LQPIQQRLQRHRTHLAECLPRLGGGIELVWVRELAQQQLDSTRVVQSSEREDDLMSHASAGLRMHHLEERIARADVTEGSETYRRVETCSAPSLT